MLRDFYYQDDKRKETACLALEESLAIEVSSVEFGDCEAQLTLHTFDRTSARRWRRSGQRPNRSARTKTALSRPRCAVLISHSSLELTDLFPPRLQMIDDQIRLLAFQQSLESESPGKNFVGLSVNETIRQCILAGLPKKADKVKSDFKVPDKRFVLPSSRSLSLADL